MKHWLNAPYRRSTLGEFLIICSFTVTLTAAVYFYRLHPGEFECIFGCVSLLAVFSLFWLACLPLVFAQPFQTVPQRLIVAGASGLGLAFMWVLALCGYSVVHFLLYPPLD